MSTVQPWRIAAALRAAASDGHSLWVDAQGSSMDRTIVSGDQVRIGPEARPRWGSVWAYCGPDGAILVHRFIGRRPGGLLFQGDGRGAPDPLVGPDVLIGRVTAVRTPDGRVRTLGTRDRLRRGLPLRLRSDARRVAASLRRRSGRIRR
ncbi:MAG: S24 family peptidase [Acidimicrobiales bacterium]|nr:S24 family peptidase [Acidimicrobiales bacterium]